LPGMGRRIVVLCVDLNGRGTKRIYLNHAL
jgi:hypothetical protein